MAAVLDAVSKGPIRHARVTVDGDAAHTLTTDSAGLFALPRDPGTVNLLIEADGYDAERVAVELTGRSEYRFYLKKRVVSAGRTAAPPASQRPLEPATSADSSRAVRVGGAIQVPTKTKDVRPVYPPIAQAARVQGAVIVEAVIGVDGSVTDARVLRSIPLLDEAALDAVKQWEFTPTLLNGRPVAVIMTVTVNFSLTTDADDILAHINRLEALGDAKAAADLLRSAFDGPTMVPGGSVFDELRARLKTANTAQIAAALKLIQSQR
jgi:TonB family protein